MQFTGIETELTTAMTDLVLALVCIGLVAIVLRSPVRRNEPQRALVWAAAFSFLCVAAFLGFIAHGFVLGDSVRDAVWQPLYLSLGLTVSLFVAGVVIDLSGNPVSRSVIFALAGLGIGFYGVTVLISGAFLVFVLYEALALLFAFLAYLYLALSRRAAWAGWMASGIGVSIVAAGIQATGTLTLRVIWEFDHNGIFHVVQIPGVLLLLKGILPERRFTSP
jgi:hypothetical protein